MGSFLSRSSSVRPESAKSRWRRGKRKRFQKIETSPDSDDIQNNNEHKNSNGNLVDTPKEWNKGIDQQQISNIHGDPPGAPSTYSTNYPMIQNDLMNQSWSSHHDANNQYFRGNSHSMTTTSNIPYDPNQYMQRQLPNSFINQPQQVVVDERPSKKVQFARPIEQQTVTRSPIAATQSWHEPSVTTTDVSTSTTRQDPVLNRQSVHRPLVPKTNTVLAQIPIEKPIYVGIDHRATLAERGQTTAHKHHHKGNNDSTHNHRSRPHAHHQHKHHESSDSSPSKNNIQSNKSFDPAQGNISNTHRSLTTTSTSTSTPNKLIQHTEQQMFDGNEIKIPKTRSNRQHTEQQTLINSDIKQSRNKKNHSQNQNQQPQSQQNHQEQHHQQQQQQRTTVNRNNSPLRTETARRVENKQPGSPVTRIPISQSQQRQKQTTMSMPTTANLTRTRV